MIGLLRRRRFMRDHHWTEAHLSAYIDRDLDAPQRQRLHRHTEDCPQCRRMLETLQRTVRALRRIGIEESQPSGTGPSEPISDSVIAYLCRTGWPNQG